MRKYSVQLLRLICFTEAVSFLVLLFIAMPLKYMKGIDSAVSIPGMIHGWLFLLFVVILIYAAYVRRWHLKYPLALFIASLIPFAPFFFEKWLRKEHAQLQ